MLAVGVCEMGLGIILRNGNRREMIVIPEVVTCNSDNQRRQRSGNPAKEPLPNTCINSRRKSP
jgi:hypothetical protein